jgi:anti-sigma B factor antagonist
MTRDELFIEMCLRTKLLSQAQIEDCRKLRGMLSENSFNLTVPEIVARKELLNPDQLRLVNVGIRYEEMRQDDVELGEFILQKGFLPIEKINECLSKQEAPYREGRYFPRLQDMILEKGYLSPQQLHVIVRAREQLDTSPAPLRQPGSSPRLPPARLATLLPPIAPTPPEPKPVRSGDVKSLEAGLRLDSFQVTLRKPRIKEGAKEPEVYILELHGSLDAHTSKPFHAYLGSLMDAGGLRLVAACDHLEYISSAGISVLTGAVKRCRDAKGDLRLANPNPKLKKIMDIVGLQSLVRIYDQERAAIISFKYG